MVWSPHQGQASREQARTPSSSPGSWRLASSREQQDPQHSHSEVIVTVILGDSGSNLILFEAQNNPSSLPAYFLNAVLNSNDDTCGGGRGRDLGCELVPCHLKGLFYTIRKIIPLLPGRMD